MKKVAVMQPYAFPYIGYFQLINAVDTFVFYDDVNFIKGGWINRNNILVNEKPHLFTIPLTKASPNQQICDIKVNTSHNSYSNILKTIEMAYKKAPYFDSVFPLISNVIINSCDSLNLLAQKSVSSIATYLNLTTEFKASSIDYSNTRENSRADRLLAICSLVQSGHYINPIGGQELYDKDYFKQRGVILSFIKSLPIQYKQYKSPFIPSLSIIDVLMFNSVSETRDLLNSYELI